MTETCDPRITASSEEGKGVHHWGEFDALLFCFVVKLDGFQWEIQPFTKTKVDDDT